MKNDRQSDTILQKSPMGDSQSNRAVENAVREAEGMIRTRKVFVQYKCVATVACATCGRDHHTVRESPRWQGCGPKEKERGAPATKSCRSERRSCGCCPKTIIAEASWSHLHQFGGFVGIVLKTGALVVLTPEGTVLVKIRDGIRKSCQVRCAPWDSNPMQVKYLKIA